jgi:hypothetical protein
MGAVAPLDPGVGDHHVKAPKAVDRRVHRRLDLPGVGGIGGIRPSSK